MDLKINVEIGAARRNLETTYIVGLDCGSVFRHAITMLVMVLSSISPWDHVGGGRRRSRISINADTVIVFSPSDCDEKEEFKSPSCFPIINSRAKTRKLQTSHDFSVTFIVVCKLWQQIKTSLFVKNIGRASKTKL